MNPRSKFLLKVGAALLVLFITGWFVAVQSRAFWDSGEAGAKVWFYDPTRKRLYSTSKKTVPPDSRTSGGVRAVVVAFKTGEKDRHKLKVAYLETYRPELKAELVQIIAARAGKKYEEPTPSRDYLQTNTLVRLLDETNWYSASSADGQRVTSEWRSWRGPEGQRPVICVP